MSYITAVFDSIGNAITQFISVFGTSVNGMGSILWTTNATTQALEPTMLGALVAVVAGVGIFYFLLRLVIGLVRLRG